MMEARRAAQALARASSSLATSHDVAGALASLMQNCRDGLGVDAIGILVEVEGHLELLASSSHDAAELEVHQLHVDEGPCIDAHHTGEPLEVSGRRSLLDRWPVFAPTMLGAGFGAVHAAPLMWQTSSFGAMGLFRRSDTPFTDDEHAVAQAFADIATILVVQLDDLRPDELARRLARALDDRVVIEQAKGVLADQRDVSTAHAYDILVAEADEHAEPLTAWAARVVAEAQTPPGRVG